MVRARPSVLVVIPTLGERLTTLAQSLDSVSAQTGVSVHLVVVVPGRASAAREIASRSGATVVDDPNRGLSGAVNAGVAVGAGENYFAWLGDDDLLAPGGLAALGHLLDGHAGSVVAYGGCAYIDEGGRHLAMSRAGRLAKIMLSWGPDLLPQPASLTRLDALVAAGGYDESLKYAMDLDMFLRLKAMGPFVWTRTQVASFRWHADSLTVANRDQSLAESELVKRRHLPAWLRPWTPVWDVPVRRATRIAARQVNTRARRVAGTAPS